MHQQEEIELEGIDLMEYIETAWKHRWQIIIPSVVLAVLAGLASFLLPKVWEVEAIIVPSKFLVQTDNGDFKEVLVAPPMQVAGLINEGAYNGVVSAGQNIELQNFPKIKAENIRNTNLVRISIQEKNPQRAKEIVLSLYDHLKSDFDKKIDVEISGLNNQVDQKKNKIRDLDLNIESIKIEKEKTKRDIEADKNKLDISGKRIFDVQEEIKSVRNRVSELDDLQRKSLAEKREGAESLALLLYSNEVQQNLRYLNSLEDKISAERVNIQNLTFSIRSKEQLLLQFDNQISQIQNTLSNEKNGIKLLEDKKNRIDYTQMIKPPTTSFGPVAPNKKRIVLIVGFLSFCLSLGVVIFRYTLEKRKKSGPEKA